MKHIFIILIAIFSFCSCVRYDALPFTGEVLPRRTGYITGVTNDWLYFNLSTGETFNEIAPSQDIKEGEQYNRTDWDIAFCGYSLRTNSGTSGCGNGGAIDLGYGNYHSWTNVEQLPKNTLWAVDDSTVNVTISQNDWSKYLIANGLDYEEHPWFDPNSGPPTTKTSANPVLSSAITFAAPPPTYTPSMHTYAVRSADGKSIYKLQLVSWFHSEIGIGEEGGRISYYVENISVR